MGLLSSSILVPVLGFAVLSHLAVFSYSEVQVAYIPASVDLSFLQNRAEFVQFRDAIRDYGTSIFKANPKLRDVCVFSGMILIWGEYILALYYLFKLALWVVFFVLSFIQRIIFWAVFAVVLAYVANHFLYPNRPVDATAVLDDLRARAAPLIEAASSAWSKLR
mmetsp:Transcript_19717/g.33863  ORF Transcript_19717/g.33863 Transcript_19717/m.33863 type:complete len:164 (-) Transcript_19717:482-973(-)